LSNYQLNTVNNCALLLQEAIHLESQIAAAATAAAAQY